MNDRWQHQRPGLDSLIEDVFGLNIRGLKTLWQLIIRPRDVFESARFTDWRSRYTPTIRLTFSVITVFMLLSFFWAAEDGPFYQMILVQLEEAAKTNPDLPPADQVLDAFFAAYSFSYPFVYMLIHAVIGVLVFFWGSGTGWVTRIRLYFALLVMGMTFSLFMMVLSLMIEREAFPLFALTSFALTYVVYCLTYVRGMWGVHSPIGLGARALAIGFIISIGDLLVSSGAGICASYWINWTVS
nr:hypothetical protein [Hyphomonas sp. Mor2]